MKINNKVYDILKWVAVLLLPALSTFIAYVFPLWGIPYGNEISKTITALAVFIGAIIGISSIAYQRDKK
jgi:hypothetical protein